MSKYLLKKKLEKHPFLIMAHRGFWGGNIIENTIESSALAFKAGSDIVEVDVCKTTDDRYYLFHDGNELKLFLNDKNFKEYTSKEIDSMPVYNSIGTISGTPIARLSDFLAWLPEDTFVNLDRSWDYWSDPNYFSLLKESGKEKQVILKSPVKKEHLDHFSKNGTGFYYVPIVKSKADCALVQSYPDIDTIGLELIVTDEESELLDQVWLKELQEKGLLFVANAENLGENFNLFAGNNDDTAMFSEEKWQPFVDAGMTIIQTDWPNFLHAFRESIKKEI